MSTRSRLPPSRRLSLPVFGLLSYLESLLLFFAAIALGDRLEPADWMMFSLLALAVVLMALDAIRAARRDVT